MTAELCGRSPSCSRRASATGRTRTRAPGSGGVDSASFGQSQGYGARVTGFAQIEPLDLLALVRIKHRGLIKAAHPDAGGSHEAAAALNAALAAAEAELTS